MTPTAADLLVVEDDEASRNLLRRRLQRQGYGVVAAADGRAALQQIEERRFDLVLLDIDMPGMSGLDVLTEIRRRNSLFELPVIMVTASQDGGDVREALTRGANDYITKPVNFPVAAGRIATQLSMRDAAVWDWNLESDEMHFSPRWMDMLGFDHDQTCWTAEEWLARVHPEDAGRLRSAIAAHAQGETPYFEIEHRVLRSNGSWRSMVTRGLGVRDDSGPIARMVGWSAVVPDGGRGETAYAAPSRGLLLDRLRSVIGRSAAGILAGARG